MIKPLLFAKTALEKKVIFALCLDINKIFILFLGKYFSITKIIKVSNQ
jgi:hypothetical protein